MGTNTFNLLIAEVEPDGEYTPLYKSKVGVKLGEGGFEKNYITEAAMQRAFVALHAQINAIKNKHCDRIFCFATSAIRKASNARNFTDKVRDQFGISVHVIDGEREAELIYHGVRLSGALTSDPALIMDIGGGSTEFITATDQDMQHGVSFEIGVSRLLERFKPEDPLSDADVRSMEDYLDAQISEVFTEVKQRQIDTLIGCSGSFETFSDLMAHREGRFEETVGRSTLSLDREGFETLLDDLIASSRSDREGMEGMAALRINIIVLSALMARLVLKRTDIRHVQLSRYSLREGVLFDVLKGKI